MKPRSGPDPSASDRLRPLDAAARVTDDARGDSGAPPPDPDLVEAVDRDDELRIYSLRAVDRVVDLVEALVQAGAPVSLSTLSSSVNLPKSSTFRYLAALERRGWVRRGDHGTTYQLTAESVLGGLAPPSTPRLDRIVHQARPLLGQLCQANQLAAVLSVLEGAHVRILWLELTPSLRRLELFTTTDRPSPFMRTAAGRALVSQLADSVVHRLAEEVAAATDGTADGTTGWTSGSAPVPSAPDWLAGRALVRDLHRVRGDGFAVVDHVISGVAMRSVAVPVPGTSVALSALGPSGEVPPPRLPALVRVLRRAAVLLARRTGEP
ncbi:IclR family transcriptional regulator [Nakamurella leprariae]|uniref:Helix-turn-helix domain-containing protein n=1 Tax=Nakamurella leprariae TaxID=2803911 RepID=A0A938YD31_9ACTN|nr:helix-turn-helix domain-containing protein [Nakamurella leprariae]MBM9467383.1 helix-turn-helix domain-containing protein [Nakamurella leprariae]